MNWSALLNLVLSALGVGIAAIGTALGTGAAWKSALLTGLTAAGGALTNHLRSNPLGGN